jgi:phage-related minor tail protein
MDEEIERLVISVRADTAGFARDVDAMRGSIENGLGGGAERAGRTIESALLRSIRSGKLGFDDLKRVALSVMDEIAAAAIRNGVGAMAGGAGSGGLLSLATTAIGALLGAPGRATGGPVSPGRAYMVGERGPELFVPAASGQVLSGANGAGRDVRVSITINAPGGNEPAALARSGRQVARAVRAALVAAE